MYQFDWKGQDYTLAPVTAKLKQAFVAWLKPRYLREAKELLDTGEYMLERERVIAGSIYWTNNMSIAVATAIYSADGERQLLRLMLGDAGKGLNDDDLDELRVAKDEYDQAVREADAQGLARPDPFGFALAFDLVMSESDAKKAKPAPDCSPAPTSMTLATT